MRGSIRFIAFACCLIIATLTGFSRIAYGQVPERCRLDLSLIYIYGTASGKIGSLFLPLGDQVGPTNVRFWADLAGTCNVTERLVASIDIPFGLLERHDHLVLRQPLSADERTPNFDGSKTGGDTELAWGDFQIKLGLNFLRERNLFPGTRIDLEFALPTARFAGMGMGFFRAGGGFSLWKSFHPRFSIVGNASATFFKENDELKISPTKAYGAGMAIGVTRALQLTLTLEQILGGALSDREERVLSPRRDLQASADLTLYSKGRPKTSISILLGGLKTDDPMFIVLALRGALFSL